MISGELLYIVPGSPVLHDRELETVGLFEAHARPRVARSRGGARAAEVNECEQLPSVLSDTRVRRALWTHLGCSKLYEIAASDFDLAVQVAMWSWEFKQGILSYRGEGSMYDTRTSASRAPESQSRPSVAV